MSDGHFEVTTRRDGYTIYRRGQLGCTSKGLGQDEYLYEENDLNRARTPPTNFWKAHDHPSGDDHSSGTLHALSTVPPRALFILRVISRSPIVFYYAVNASSPDLR